MNSIGNKFQQKSDFSISRRSLLSAGLITVASSIIPVKSIAAVKDILLPERILCFYNLYTKEDTETVYWREGKYLPEGLDMINHMLRDIRTGRVKAMNRNLLDLLFVLQQKLGTDEPFHIISGYRTPKSNSILSKQKKGVAKNSMHIYGKAVDIRVPNSKLKDVRSAAMKLKGGGVGYYPVSDFVHVDVGNVRYWRG